MGLFGIGDGKMELSLASLNVSPGSKLDGTATLTLNTDVKAKGVIASLVAEQVFITRNMRGQVQRRTETLYRKDEQLDTEKLYTKGSGPLQYKFSFVVPQTGPTNANQQSTPVGLIGGIIGSFAGAGEGPVRWFVKVKLDLPLAFDVSKSQEINIVV